MICFLHSRRPILMHKYMQMLHISMSAEFQGTLVRWGTSVGLAIPTPIRDGMKLNAGDKN